MPYNMLSHSISLDMKSLAMSAVWIIADYLVFVFVNEVVGNLFLEDIF